MSGLTLKQQRFVAAYMGESQGNATDAARRAGYKGTDQTLGAVGAENLKKPQIVSAIQDATKDDPLIWGRDELQRFWTELAQGQGGDETKDRLKASELLGKSQAVFIQRVEVKQTQEMWLDSMEDEND